MQTFVLINTETHHISRQAIETDIDPTAETKTPWQWWAVVDIMAPSDQALPKLEGPTLNFDSQKRELTRTWIPRAYTPDEADQAKSAVVSSINEPIFTILLNQENRLRVLETKPTVTSAQFFALIKTQVAL